MATLHRWDDIPLEAVNESLSRKLICGERIMLAHIQLQPGCIIPKHEHEHEQITCVQEGLLRLWLGEHDERQVDVGPGEVLHIPSHLPHRGEALQHCIVLDVFSPPREDWINRTDGYLRGAHAGAPVPPAR